MTYNIFQRSSSIILTNDEGNNKEKKKLWYEFQATYTSTYTYFGHKIHLNVTLISIIVLQSFSLPHRQWVMYELGCSDLYASWPESPVWVYGGWLREMPQKSRHVLPSLCSAACTCVSASWLSHQFTTVWKSNLECGSCCHAQARAQPKR